MQMEFEIEIDTHNPVTQDEVTRAMAIIVRCDYESLCRFLEPQTEEERKIIIDCLRRYENG